MKSATLTAHNPFLLAPADTRPATRRARTVRQQPAAAPATGLFARLERETAIGSRPETVVFALLALTGAAWPIYEVIRSIAGF